LLFHSSIGGILKVFLPELKKINRRIIGRHKFIGHPLA